MPNFNPHPLDVFNDRTYKQITNGGVQTAIGTIATQLSTFRFAATVSRATMLLRMLIEDIIRAQTGQVVENILPPAAGCENLISDAPTAAALGTIRTYLVGIATPTYPPVGQLPARAAFQALCTTVVECI